MLDYKVGDWIIVTKAEGCQYHRAGDVGVLVKQDSDGDWWADFSQWQGDRTKGDGVWIAGDGRLDDPFRQFELYTGE